MNLFAEIDSGIPRSTTTPAGPLLGIGALGVGVYTMRRSCVEAERAKSAAADRARGRIPVQSGKDRSLRRSEALTPLELPQARSQMFALSVV
jgi:hypothetical protein